VPGPLEEDRRAAAGARPPSPVAFDFRMRGMRPTKTTAAGEIRIVDSANFPISKTMAMAHVLVKPGGLRELHWHPNADEWLYFIRGRGRITLFVNGGKARTADFTAGDVGYLPRTLGHYIENTGDGDLVFLEMFKADRYRDLALSDWLSHTPPELVMSHLRISRATLDAIPKENLGLVPRRRS
jgi:oxalate decarboxylase